MNLRGLKESVSSFLADIRQQPTQGLVGLDIGPDYVKILKINSSKSPFVLEKLSVAPTPTGAIVKDEIKNPSALSNVISNMMEECGITTKSAVIAIPRSLAIFKNTSVDSRLNADEIEKKVWIEANRHFPDLIGDIFLDFSINTPHQNATRLDISLVACRKTQVQPYLDVIKQAGLTVKIVDVDCNALERTIPMMVQDSTNDQNIALLNLNTNLSSLVIVNNHHLIHAHDQPYDGRRLLNLTNDYLKAKAITTDEQLAALINDPDYNNLLKDNLMAHLRHTLHFFFSSKPNININQIILAGDCAVTPNIATYIQHEFNIETIIGNPFTHMSLSPDVNETTLKKYTPALMLCCGLALSQPV